MTSVEHSNALSIKISVEDISRASIAPVFQSFVSTCRVPSVTIFYSSKVSIAKTKKVTTVPPTPNNIILAMFS